MAKPLSTRPPSSSVARMFDVAAATAAVAEPGTVTRPPAASTAPEPHRPVPQPPPARPATDAIKREVTLCEQTDETLARCLAAFQRGTRSRLTTSHLVRAILLALGRALPAVEYEAQRLGPLRLPSNGPQAAGQRAEFERRLADAVAAAMRQGR